jgi:hypothetical protein
MVSVAWATTVPPSSASPRAAATRRRVSSAPPAIWPMAWVMALSDPAARSMPAAWRAVRRPSSPEAALRVSEVSPMAAVASAISPIACSRLATAVLKSWRSGS